MVNNMKDIAVRLADIQDVREIAEIEKSCFRVPWTYESLTRDLKENSSARYFVAETDRVVGYMSFWKVVDEGQINNIAVLPDYRNRGIGGRLLDFAIETGKSMGVNSFTLEVRSSNIGAVKLYEKHGFEADGIRRGYYQDNGEDALIMWYK